MPALTCGVKIKGGLCSNSKGFMISQLNKSGYGSN